MAQTTAVPGIETPSIPLGQLAPWALFYGLIAVLVLFFLSADPSVISVPGGTAIHEWVHDGRHLLGIPCH